MASPQVSCKVDEDYREGRRVLCVRGRQAGCSLRKTDLRSRPIGLLCARLELSIRRRHMKLVALAAAVAALVVPSALAATPTLNGTVGPGFTIALTKAGAKVTKLKAGTYVIKVSDKSNIHNFRLKGPGVNKATSVAAMGSATWKVTLKAGKYTIVCDPHATLMKA